MWAATGCDEHDRSTWTLPVIRIGGRADPPFAAAINTQRLHSAFDQLAGPGRWVPRSGIGTFPIRFPVDEAPGDDGWHIESTGADATGNPTVDPASRERLLLLLFLFSDVGTDDAPTRLRLGSHLHGARLLFKEAKTDRLLPSCPRTGLRDATPARSCGHRRRWRRVAVSSVRRARRAATSWWPSEIHGAAAARRRIPN